MQNKHSLFTFSDESLVLNFPQVLLTYSNHIRVLMVGDILGRAGRRILKKTIPLLKKYLSLDFISINGENLAGGFGITEKIYDEMMLCHIDAITMGNHWKDKADIHNLRKKYHNIILPQNLKGITGVETAPQFTIERVKKYLNIINLMGNFAMKEEYNNPFEFLDRERSNFIDKLKSGSHIILADIHAEASSEKQALMWSYNGIFAGIIGTHTHVPTADERITEQGTAFVTDLGMTGAFDSVIGMNKERVIKKLSTPNIKLAHEVAEDDPWLNAFLIEINLSTNLAHACARIQCRGIHDAQWLISRISPKDS